MIEIDFEKRTAEIFAGNWSTFFEMKAHARRRQKELYTAQELEKIRVVESAAQKREWIVIGKAKKPKDNDKMLRGYQLNRSAQKLGASAKALENRVKRLDTIEKPFERLPLEFNLSMEKIEGKPAIELTRVVSGSRALHDDNRFSFIFAVWKSRGSSRDEWRWKIDAFENDHGGVKTPRWDYQASPGRQIRGPHAGA